jgi:hypothetical protein
MEATCSSETSDDFHRTTRRYIPEDSTFQIRYFMFRFWWVSQEFFILCQIQTYEEIWHFVRSLLLLSHQSLEEALTKEHKTELRFVTVPFPRCEAISLLAKCRPELANPQGSLKSSMHGTKYLLFILQSAQPYQHDLWRSCHQFLIHPKMFILP